ncbi:MAG: integron integrase [Nitrospirae bacterium]|nr:integron integrase [Nitrospirota bacterium]NTW65124.1 integron integrase [Nitrospirota bacterium]
MQIIPTEIYAHYDDILKQRKIPPSLWNEYRKWLRFFLDFCSKYPTSSERADQVRLFSEKLRSKGQTAQQVEQAADAVSLFFASQRDQPAGRLSAAVHATPGIVQNTAGQSRDQRSAAYGAFSGKRAGMVREIPGPQVETVSSGWRGRRYDDWRCLRTSGHPAWDAIIGLLADEIQARHYSRKTLQHYANWTRKFEFYLSHKDPAQLTSRDVKSYLTCLAVQCKVSSSTQNLAFNALLFLFRHVLKRDFGNHKDIPRAKKSTYVPVVLSRDEVQEVFARLHHPHQLIAKLQYGCGLRCFEAVKVRVKDFNFDAGLLTIKGKGGKSRAVPIPGKIVPELLAQLAFVKKLHADDTAAGYAGVFLEDQLEKKYPNAAEELQWQWFFPQESLTFVSSTGERRRYHVHESRFQEALYLAVKKAQLTKRVSTHTLRHSFATHLLQANYDIRTIQMLLGHSDVRTTMIYTHCVPSRTLKELKSPLDF